MLPFEMSLLVGLVVTNLMGVVLLMKVYRKLKHSRFIKYRWRLLVVSVLLVGQGLVALGGLGWDYLRPLLLT